jgi:ribosomal protein S18 acetylase RimI-like enzyme
MIVFGTRQLTEKEICDYLLFNNNVFFPPLSDRVDIKKYSLKLHELAIHFCASNEKQLVGFIACYFNSPVKEYGFISSVSVIREFKNMQIATNLLIQVVDYGKKYEFKSLRLQVNRNNLPAKRLYEKFGFKEKSNKDDLIETVLDLRNSQI